MAQLFVALAGMELLEPVLLDIFLSSELLSLVQEEEEEEDEDEDPPTIHCPSFQHCCFE